MGYRAIKTSESRDKFLSTLFKFRTKPSGARFSSSEGILSDWVSGFGRQVDVVWSCPLTFCDMWILFDIILASFCDTLTLFDAILTLSTRSPLNRPLSYSLTECTKNVEFQMKRNTKNISKMNLMTMILVHWIVSSPSKPYCIVYSILDLHSLYMCVTALVFVCLFPFETQILRV